MDGDDFHGGAAPFIVSSRGIGNVGSSMTGNSYHEGHEAHKEETNPNASGSGLAFVCFVTFVVKN
jgi:hypothetical protein